jgi:hypothetical protein
VVQAADLIATRCRTDGITDGQLVTVLLEIVTFSGGLDLADVVAVLMGSAPLTWDALYDESRATR